MGGLLALLIISLTMLSLYTTSGGRSRARPFLNSVAPISLGSTDLQSLFLNDKTWHPTLETRFIQGTPGWSFFKNLYTQSGGFVAVSKDVSNFRKPDLITRDMKFEIISPEEAVARWGSRAEASERRNVAQRIDGGTLFYAQNGWGGTTYYYHFVAEVFAAAFYLFTATSNRIVPARIMQGGDQWRGFHNGLNEFFISCLAPLLVMQDHDVFQDLSSSGNIAVFDEIMIFDRWTAHAHSKSVQIWNKAPMAVYEEITPRPNWWAPIRGQLETLLLSPEEIKRNNDLTKLPVVSYVSRQVSWHRKLEDGDHEKLVAALQQLQGIDFQVLELENLSTREQTRVALNTDIMLGPHGNGLTHEIWMKPGSSLIEFFADRAFIREYEMLATAMGNSYHTIHNDTVYDWKSDKPGIKMTDTFDRSDMRVDADTVIGVITEILRTRSSRNTFGSLGEDQT